jgi:hypothetical protein
MSIKSHGGQGRAFSIAGLAFVPAPAFTGRAGPNQPCYGFPDWGVVHAVFTWNWTYWSTPAILPRPYVEIWRVRR